MSNIQISRVHGMEKSQARASAEELVEQLRASYGFDCRWEADALLFSHTAGKGEVTIDEEQLHISIKLGMLGRPLRGTLEQKIQDKLDEILG